RVQARAAPACGAHFRRLHALEGGPDADPRAQPRPRQPLGRDAPQQVSVPHDRSGDHAGRERALGEALDRALPQRGKAEEGGRMIRNPLAIAAGLVLAALTWPAAAQTKAGGTMAQIAAYDKPDRAQKLIEGAKQEGELTIYTSAQSDDMGALTAAFE